MKTYYKKAKEGEILIYEEVLDKIADKYNAIFSLLILPKALKIDRENSLVELSYYNGETFNEKWNESTGGSQLGLDLSAEIPEMLYELSKIDTAVVFDCPRLKSIPRLVFSTREYIPEFEIIARRLCDDGLLKKEEINLAASSVQEKFPSPLMLNNGDFYPRNFIRMPDGKIVLIDWETWNANSRANIVDHPENVAAYCFVHMWNNLVWQKNYVKELRKKFTMTRIDFQRAILIKSLEMANFWYNENGDNLLCQSQLTMFRNALREEYMNELWL